MVNIDWDALTFQFSKTKSVIRFKYTNGAWDDGRLTDDYTVTMSVAANVLHYGQAIFEGLKAFRCKDGKVRIFRPDENGRRLNSSARQIVMPEFPVERFVEACRQLVADNIEYVPPYGSGGSMYIRPVMYGTTPQIGVNPASDFELVIMCMPVGSYYKNGIKPVDAMISRDFDRAAPHGTGHIKCAGNYAASLLSGKTAKEKYHCPVALFLDPGTHTYIDEFGTSNFLAISKDGKYVTSLSESILPSITNKSLMQVAEDLGMPVERRKVRAEELADFAEVAACGTAVVITPVGRIMDGDKVYDYHLTTIGPALKAIYDRVLAIQHGEYPDTHNWMVQVD
ncbi:MAG: branched-chain amino acid aminotransferase [Victivallaceae bacterium]|nr:branched-chain amino acid aminotransferase [Victivallaceae bacterium]